MRRLLSIDSARNRSGIASEHCGIKPFGEGELVELGGHFYAINVACLDDVMLDVLLAAPIVYEDGRHDRWDRVPVQASLL